MGQYYIFVVLYIYLTLLERIEQFAIKMIDNLKSLFMALEFNSLGYLDQTTALTYEEFMVHFGVNSGRMRQLDNAVRFFRIFYQCGCRTVFVDGSFVSTKMYPGDIDLCFDLTKVDKEYVKMMYPDLFDPDEIDRIKNILQCHVFTFDEEDYFMLELFSTDKRDNPKGMIKLDLKNIIRFYDKE